MKIREWFLEIRSKRLFLLMVSIISLLTINYNILKSARNTLVVIDMANGASSIPLFELLGTMPGAIIITYLLTGMVNRYSMKKTFWLVLSSFLLFFLLFVSLIYPHSSHWKETLMHYGNPFPGYLLLVRNIPYFCSMLFFAMGELWKIALLSVLFWGLINQYTMVIEARKLYALLMLGGSLGTIISGPIISFCNSDLISNSSWNRSLLLMMTSLTIIGIATGCLYAKLHKLLEQSKETEKVQPEKGGRSFIENIALCLRSPCLTFLAWITAVDYIAFSLGEVVFLDILKEKFPDARQYCDYLGRISSWSGILTLFTLTVAPYLLSRYRWSVTALVTPISLLLTESAFFLVLWIYPSHIEWIVVLGTLFVCIVRTAKSGFHDPAKELAFLALPAEEKMPGKLIIDGICSRIGRGTAALFSISSNQLLGTVWSTASLLGPLAIGLVVSSTLATWKLGKLINNKWVALKS